MLKNIIAEAHCDVPCGIYEPTVAKLAAMTVKRMTEQLIGLEKFQDSADLAARKAFIQSIQRRAEAKEEHAEKVKREIQILWSDFFKPEHVEKFPQLHDLVWKTLKEASSCKQEISQTHAENLVKMVDEIAKIFYDAKGKSEKFEAYKLLTDTVY